MFVEPFAEMRSHGAATNMNVAETAKARLRSQPHLSGQRIWCELDGGDLYLHGQVPSYYLKQLAQAAMVGLSGVAQIINEIEVVW